jgi:hypothetical protein
MAYFVILGLEGVSGSVSNLPVKVGKGAEDAVMTLEASGVQSEGRYVHANGIDIYYVEAGQGEPLVLLLAGKGVYTVASGSKD